MASDITIPSPCEESVFQEGKSLLYANTGPVGGASVFEQWVVAVREKSGEQVDWHYSGGVAHVLYLGDRDKIIEAARNVPLPEQIHIWQWCEADAEGLYRRGVNEAADNAIAVFWDGDMSTYMLAAPETTSS